MFLEISGWGLHFIKKETLAQVFSSDFCEISKNTFSTKHLWETEYFNVNQISQNIWSTTFKLIQPSSLINTELDKHFKETNI